MSQFPKKIKLLGLASTREICNLYGFQTKMMIKQISSPVIFSLLHNLNYFKIYVKNDENTQAAAVQIKTNTIRLPVFTWYFGGYVGKLRLYKKNHNKNVYF